MTESVFGDGVAKCRDEVLLTTDLAEAGRAVTAVERLVGHRGEPTDRLGLPSPEVVSGLRRETTRSPV